MGCKLCEGPGGDVWFADNLVRVVHVADQDHPATCRVIVGRHVRECTDLAPAERRRVMGVVFAVEAAMREVLAPEKVNLASLGNQVPHVHWHVIARFVDDRHYPRPVWAEPLRPQSRPTPGPDVLVALRAAVKARCGAGSAEI